MTEQASGGSDVAGMMRRQWPVVLAAFVVATVAGFLWSRATSEGPTYSASQRVRVSSNISNVQNAPSADTVVSIATKGLTLRAALASAGLEPGVSPQVSAAIDSRNRNVVVVTVKSPEEEVARRAIEALSEQTRIVALQPIMAYVAYQRGRAADYESHANELEEQLAQVQSFAARAPAGSSDHAAYTGTSITLRLQTYSMRDSARDARYLADLAGNYVTVEGDPAVSTTTDTGRAATAVMQGVIVGLLAGLAVALVRERLLRGARDRA